MGVIFGGLGIWACWTLIAMGIEYVPDLPFSLTVVLFLSLISVILGVLYLLASYGLFKMFRWGAVLAVILCAISILFSLGFIGIGYEPTLNVVTIILSVMILALVVSKWESFPS